MRDAATRGMDKWHRVMAADKFKKIRGRLVALMASSRGFRSRHRSNARIYFASNGRITFIDAGKKASRIVQRQKCLYILEPNRYEKKEHLRLAIAGVD